MRVRDVRFIQVLNLIKRYEALIISAKRNGIDTSLPEELLNEAKYALKLKKYEVSVDFVKRAGSEIVRLKREKEEDEFFKPENLENASKEQLRKMCMNYGLESIGLRTTLVSRLREHYEKEILPKKQQEEEETVSEEDMLPDPTVGSWPVPEQKPTRQPLKAPPGADDPPAPQAEPEPSTVQESVSKPTDLGSVASAMKIGYSYLIEEERVETSFRLFSYLIKEQEFSGLCLTRTNPRKIRDKFELETVQMMWLTDQDSDRETVISPSLEGIIYIIEEYMDMGKKTILLLDGLEYLIGNNGFNPVLRFIRRLIDKISETETILIITVSPETMDEREVKLLERELEPIHQ